MQKADLTLLTGTGSIHNTGFDEPVPGEFEAPPHPGWPFTFRLAGPGTRHVVTSPVQKLLSDGPEGSVFTTLNSTYRLDYRGEGA